jgi:hypothetical protein
MIATSPLLDLIPTLFDRIGETNRYFQMFESGTMEENMDLARKFAEHMREELGESVNVEQRNNKVIITVL